MDQGNGNGVPDSQLKTGSYPATGVMLGILFAIYFAFVLKSGRLLEIA